MNSMLWLVILIGGFIFVLVMASLAYAISLEPDPVRRRAHYSALIQALNALIGMVFLSLYQARVLSGLEAILLPVVCSGGLVGFVRLRRAAEEIAQLKKRLQELEQKVSGTSTPASA